MFSPIITPPTSLNLRKRFRKRRRRQQQLMMAALVIEMLHEDDLKHLRGRLLGSKNIRRTRKKVESIWAELGGYARRAYRMSLDCFNYLHKTLEPALREEFEVGERARGGTPNGDISTKLRLSAALRFFAGGSVYDIMLTHGMSKSSVYKSVYGVVNVVNHEPSLSFNENGAKFPSHDEQKVIAKGFLAKSGADFDKIVMAIDGMLIWTIQPSRADCDKLKIGERMFHCYRKDKFGFLLMAGCDHDTKFRWADIRHPARTSDYLAWVSSELGRELENDDSDLILPDHSIAGDNAFVENMTMSTPIPGYSVTDIEDAYNFYLSQLRITIERAFGILVHRWGILRRPLSMSILKVPAIVTCLMRLHNLCIDYDSRHTTSPLRDDERTIQSAARKSGGGATQRDGQRKRRVQSAVTLNDHGAPADLMGSGHHFRDEPGGTGRRPVVTLGDVTPMRTMIKQVEEFDLRRPTIN